MPLSAALNEPKIALNGTPVKLRMFNFSSHGKKVRKGLKILTFTQGNNNLQIEAIPSIYLDFRISNKPTHTPCILF